MSGWLSAHTMLEEDDLELVVQVLIMAEQAKTCVVMCMKLEIDLTAQISNKFNRNSKLIYIV